MLLILLFQRSLPQTVLGLPNSTPPYSNLGFIFYLILLFSFCSNIDLIFCVITISILTVQTHSCWFARKTEDGFGSDEDMCWCQIWEKLIIIMWSMFWNSLSISRLRIFIITMILLRVFFFFFFLLDFNQNILGVFVKKKSLYKLG